MWLAFSEAVVIMTSNIGSEHLMVRQITDELREKIMDQVLDFCAQNSSIGWMKSSCSTP